jgi:hypothetical protein
VAVSTQAKNGTYMYTCIVVIFFHLLACNIAKLGMGKATCILLIKICNVVIKKLHDDRNEAGWKYKSGQDTDTTRTTLKVKETFKKH